MPQRVHSTFLARIARIPDSIWGPVVAGFLMLVIGLIGWATGRPLLFPSLGPSAFEDAEKPELESPRFYHTLVGHLVGLGVGFLAVTLVDAWDTPPVLSAHTLTMARVGASVLAVAITLAVMTLLHATHPAAAATTLLVALGAFRTGYDAMTVIIGVIILAVLGEVARQVRLRAIRESLPPLV